MSRFLWAKEAARKAWGIAGVTLHIPQFPGFPAPGCCRTLGSADKIFSPRIACAEVYGSSLMLIIFPITAMGNIQKENVTHNFWLLTLTLFFRVHIFMFQLHQLNSNQSKYIYSLPLKCHFHIVLSN